MRVVYSENWRDARLELVEFGPQGMHVLDRKAFDLDAFVNGAASGSRLHTRHRVQLRAIPSASRHKSPAARESIVADLGTLRVPLDRPSAFTTRNRARGCFDDVVVTGLPREDDAKASRLFTFNSNTTPAKDLAAWRFLHGEWKMAPQNATNLLSSECLVGVAVRARVRRGTQTIGALPGVEFKPLRTGPLAAQERSASSSGRTTGQSYDLTFAPNDPRGNIGKLSLRRNGQTFDEKTVEITDYWITFTLRVRTQ